MKIDARKIASVLHEANTFRVFLLYGENTGLVRERASRLVKKITNSLDDPFLVAILDKDHHDRLNEEATALSLMGGQRAIWVREAADHLTKPLENLCQSHYDSILVLEAGNLSPRSSLRSLAEKHPSIASIPCYAETGRSLEETVRLLLGRKAITPDAFRYLLAVLGSDRLLIRNEIEKLLLFVGDQPQITSEAIEQVLGDSHEYTVDDILYSVMSGQVVAADRALNRGLKEGISLIAIIRGLLYFVDRLRQVRFMMEEEKISVKNAVNKLNPPVFFKRIDSFMKALTYWNTEHLFYLTRQVQYLEYLSKQTATPTEVLCRQFMLSITQQVKEKKTTLNLDNLFSN